MASKPKNTICLWFDKDAQDAARFYAAPFPDSEVKETDRYWNAIVGNGGEDPDCPSRSERKRPRCA